MRAKRKTEKERGAALVEFALVLPLFIGVVFAIVDFSLLFWQGAQVRQGVRETGRAAAVANWGDDTSCTVTGTSPTTTTRKVMCLAKDEIGMGDSNTRIKVLLSAGGDVVGEKVVICAQYPGGSASGFYNSILGGGTTKARAVMRIEVDGDLTAAAETPLADDGWASCTV